MGPPSAAGSKCPWGMEFLQGSAVLSPKKRKGQFQNMFNMSIFQVQGDIMLHFKGKFILLIIFFQKSFISRKSMFSELSRTLGELRVSSHTL